MKLTMLGTGNALVTECYNTCFVLSENDQYFLVDGGGGNRLLSQLKKAGINWMDLRDIFLTHKHLDHLMGIVWMIRMICQTMQQGKYEGEARIYGHEEVIGLLRFMAEHLLTSKQSRFLDDRLHLIVVEDGDQKEIIGHAVTFFDIRSTKAKQFGFSMNLANAETPPAENLQIENLQTENLPTENSSTENLSSENLASRLVCCGDEPYNPCEEIYARGAKWLLHEAFCLYSQKDRFHPYEKHHSTVKDACELAEQLRVENLILYHTEEENLADRAKLYTEEGQQYYHGNLFVPEDFDTFEV